MNKKNDENLKQLNVRVEDSLLREIDAAWTKRGGFITRAQGVRWILKEGLEAIKKGA